MKKIFSSLALIAFIFANSPAANSAEVSIFLTEPTHRQADGLFLDDELVDKLKFDGRLGSLVFSPPRGNRSWFIDAQLIEEVTQMSTGYELVNQEEGLGVDTAMAWLNQLKAITRGDQIAALAYGNPSGYWINKLAPSYSDFLLALGANRLTQALGGEISPPTKYPNIKVRKVNDFEVQAFSGARKALRVNKEFMAPEAVEVFQARSALILHPDLTGKLRSKLAADLVESTYLLSNKIRIAAGRFTVTSSKQNLPITLINEFPNSLKVSLQIETSNGKLFVAPIPDQQLDGDSKLQVMIPVEVITSGESSISISLKSVESVGLKGGKKLGNQAIIPVTLKVISPVATWITTGAGVILFASALIQSYRRIRKKRK